MELPPIAVANVDHSLKAQAAKDREIAMTFQREKARHVIDVFNEMEDDASTTMSGLTPTRPEGTGRKGGKGARQKASMLDTLRTLNPKSI